MKSGACHMGPPGRLYLGTFLVFPSKILAIVTLISVAPHRHTEHEHSRTQTSCFSDPAIQKYRLRAQASLVWNTKRDKNRNHELCERGSDRATLGLENRWVGARESLCWDDRTALVLEYHCQGCDDRTWARQSPTRESSVPVSCIANRESRLAKHWSTRVSCIANRESRLAKALVDVYLHARTSVRHESR